MNDDKFFAKIEKLCKQREMGLVTNDELLHKVLETILEFKNSPRED